MGLVGDEGYGIGVGEARDGSLGWQVFERAGFPEISPKVLVHDCSIALATRKMVGCSADSGCKSWSGRGLAIFSDGVNESSP